MTMTLTALRMKTRISLLDNEIEHRINAKHSDDKDEVRADYIQIEMMRLPIEKWQDIMKKLEQCFMMNPYNDYFLFLCLNYSQSIGRLGEK